MLWSLFAGQQAMFGSGHRNSGTGLHDLVKNLIFPVSLKADTMYPYSIPRALACKRHNDS